MEQQRQEADQDTAFLEEREQIVMEEGDLKGYQMQISTHLIMELENFMSILLVAPVTDEVQVHLHFKSEMILVVVMVLIVTFLMYKLGFQTRWKAFFRMLWVLVREWDFRFIM